MGKSKGLQLQKALGNFYYEEENGNKPPSSGDSHAGPKDSGEREDAEGRLIIEAEDDLDIPALSLAFLKERGPGKASKDRDEERIIAWLVTKELEAPGATKALLTRNDIFHVRSHAQVDKAAKIFEGFSKDTKTLTIGLDTESASGDSGPALLQLSTRVGERRVTAVFQLKSKVKAKSAQHIFV